MNTPVYAENTQTIIGHLVDGKFEPTTQATSPAPTGDELDLLLDQCCSTICNYLKAEGRLDAELQMSDGQHSYVLTDGETKSGIRRGHKGVRSWITEGTLRDVNQLSPVLSAFVSDMKAKQRLRKVDPDWKFDNDCLIVVSSRFGIDAPRTIAELQAKRSAERLERERLEREQREIRQTAHKAFVESEAGREQTQQQAVHDFKEDTIRAVVDALVFRGEDHGRSKLTPEMTELERDTAVRQANAEARETLQECRRVERIIRPIVEASPLSADAIVRIYDEAESMYIEMVEDLPSEICPPFEVFVKRQFARFVAAANIPARLGATMIPPLMEGVERHLFENMKAYCDFARQNMTPEQMYVCRVDGSGNIVLDAVPVSLEEAYDQFVDSYEAAIQASQLREEL